MRVSEAIRAENPSKGSIPRNMKIRIVNIRIPPDNPSRYRAAGNMAAIVINGEILASGRPAAIKIMGISTGVSIMYGRVPLHLFSITNSATEETMLMLDMATTVEERRKKIGLETPSLSLYDSIEPNIEPKPRIRATIRYGQMK